MPTLETILLVTVAGLALSASPGPSMLYILSRSVGQSRAAGLVSAAGLATGGFVHVVLAALGLSALFSYSPGVYTAVKILGAVYLIYLGVDTLRDGGSEAEDQSRTNDDSLAAIFYQGVLVEVLNPKTMLFFVAFLPQFVDGTLGSVTAQMFLLGLLVPLTAMPSDLIVAFGGGTVAARLSASPTMSTGLKWVSGLILIGLGLHIFLG
jgi:threonine/homoserine/homoserine lactone efflux protein